MVPDFVLKDGVLTVHKEMDFDYDVSFDRVCNELINEPFDKLVIDLSRIHRITSTYIGLMAAAFFQANQRGKTIAISAKGSVLHALRVAGFDNFIKLTDSGRFVAMKAQDPEEVEVVYP